MNRFSLLIPLLLVYFLSGCSTVSVNYDYDNKADFSAIYTYNWGESNGADDELAN
ncbi:MAG: hypothetical protein JRJ37_09345, partial [Deltaproteobacteria bacterium]|nr:hypothetical protein [Deltaproteobacteria bacterium]